MWNFLIRLLWAGVMRATKHVRTHTLDKAGFKPVGLVLEALPWTTNGGEDETPFGNWCV